MKVIIIDDEELARALIKKFLETETEFEIIAEAENGFEGIKLIQELKPDLVFLDVQMPKLSGFEMLELLENPPQIIFSTAFDHYAVNAFEKNAIDYLLKPYSKDRFLKALQKAKNNIYPDFSAIQNLTPNSERVVVKNGSKIEMITKNDLIFVESYGDYVWLHSDKNKLLKQKTMKQMEDSLGTDFIRIHRSYLVNTKHILKVEPYEKYTYQLILSSGKSLSVSKSGYKLLKQTLNW